MTHSGLRAFVVVASLTCSLLAQAQDDQSRIPVATGPDPFTAQAGQFGWLRGVTTDATRPAASLRILHATLDGNDVLVDVALIDSNGNFLAGRGLDGWTAAAQCRDSSSAPRTSITPTQRLWSPSDPGVAAVICLDNSAAANGCAQRVLDALRGLVPGVAGRDSVGIIAFDHDILELAPIGPVEHLTKDIADNAIPAPSGLSGIYNAMMAGLGGLRDQGARDLDLIVVTATDDNASLAYDAAAVVRRAREGNVRIHTIRVGSSAMGYVYRYMAGATGGRAYTVPSDGVSDAAGIIREIIVSHRMRYELRIPLQAAARLCSDLNVIASFTSRVGSVSDSVRLPVKDRAYRQPRLIVASFADAADTSIASYRSQIALLAEQLQEDTTSRIELVGHVDHAFGGDAAKRATQRVRAVANALRAAGVAEDRMQLRSEGTTRPLYYFQILPWQQRMNNRVDVRRLSADEQPFVIVVDQVATEEQATKQIESWETRGYKAYFDPVVVSREPAYRIVLWGYSTITDAQQDARTVRSKYKVKAVVE